MQTRNPARGNNSTAAKGVALRTWKIILTSTRADLAAARARADDLARTEGCDVEVDVPDRLAIYVARSARC